MKHTYGGQIRFLCLISSHLQICKIINGFIKPEMHNKLHDTYIFNLKITVFTFNFDIIRMKIKIWLQCCIIKFLVYDDSKSDSLLLNHIPIHSHCKWILICWHKNYFHLLHPRPLIFFLKASMLWFLYFHGNVTLTSFWAGWDCSWQWARCPAPVSRSSPGSHCTPSSPSGGQY